MESDQAIMRMITQVMSTVAAHSAPGLYAPPYPDQTVSHSSLQEEPSFHTLTPPQRSNTRASGYAQHMFAPSGPTDDQPLSSVFHELNKLY